MDTSPAGDSTSEQQGTRVAAQPMGSDQTYRQGLIVRAGRNDAPHSMPVPGGKVEDERR